MAVVLKATAMSAMLDVNAFFNTGFKFYPDDQCYQNISKTTDIPHESSKEGQNL